MEEEMEEETEIHYFMVFMLGEICLQIRFDQRMQLYPPRATESPQ